LRRPLPPPDQRGTNTALSYDSPVGSDAIRAGLPPVAGALTELRYCCWAAVRDRCAVIAGLPVATGARPDFDLRQSHLRDRCRRQQRQCQCHGGCLDRHDRNRAGIKARSVLIWACVFFFASRSIREIRQGPSGATSCVGPVRPLMPKGRHGDQDACLQRRGHLTSSEPACLRSWRGWLRSGNGPCGRPRRRHAQ